MPTMFRHCSSSRTGFSLAFALLLGISCAACGESGPTPMPARPDPALARNPGYTPPLGWRQECLGRQVFDVPGEIEWGMTSPKTPWYPTAELSPELAVQGDVWRYGYDDGNPNNIPFIQVSITPKVDKAVFERAKLHEEVEILNEISKFKELLATDKRILERYYAGKSEMTSEDAQEYENEVKSLEEGLTALPTYHNYDLKLPESYATLFNTGITVYLWRDSRVIRFKIYHQAMSQAEQEKRLLDIIRRFRLRAPHEIPAEPGVCLPHGFIADDGQTYYDIKNTFRLKDVPNVTYTLHVGDRLPGTEPFGLEIWTASTLAAPGLWGAAANGQVTQRFGPEETRIGALPALIGGYAMRPDLEKGQAQEAVYTLRAGYEGELNSNTTDLAGNRFPLVTFEVNSYAKDANPAFTRPAPPLADTRQRLQAIMKSVRWREVRQP